MTNDQFAMTNDQSANDSAESPVLQSPAGLSDAELSEAKRYGRHELACAVADKMLDAGYLAVAAFLLAGPIDRRLHGWPLLEANWTLRLAAMFLVVTGLHIAVSFPLSFYSGHVLEHKFGLSAQGFGGWLWRYVKHNLLSLALSLGMVLGLYWLIWTTRGVWWLAAAGAFFLVSIILGQLAPVLILPLFYRIQRLDAPDISARIRHLAESTGLSIEGVYRIDFSDETVKANAMLAGLGRTRRVLLGDTLINGFMPDEIEVVFAHEIGHHALHHIRKIMLLGLFYSAAGFWACDRLLAAFVGQGGKLDYAQLPTYTLPLVLWLLTMFAMLTEPLKNAISRRFERQADRYALDQTGLREAYLSAFRKLARLNKDDPAPHWLDVLLFHGHPPVAERLKMAEETDNSPLPFGRGAGGEGLG